MIDREHDLVCLIEEVSELSETCNNLIKAATKALRFGLNDKKVGTEKTNAENIVKEYIDVRYYLRNLASKGLISMPDESEINNMISHTEERKNRYRQISINNGTLDDFNKEVNNE